MAMELAAEDEPGPGPVLYLSARAGQNSTSASGNTSNARRAISSAEWPFKEKIIAAAARAESGNLFLHELPSHTNPLSLAKTAFDAVVSRLKEQHLMTSRIVPGHFQWMLPQKDWTAQQLAIFSKFQICPMIVTNGDLSRILEIELSTAVSPPTTDGQHFYFRSWTLTAEELHKVLNYMTDHDDTFTETTEWRTVLTIHDNDNPHSATYFTIRYVGKCAGPKRAYDRFVEDLKERTNGILHEFMKVVELLLPEVAEAATIHWIKPASLQFPTTTRYNADDVERVLVEFFGHQTLLNRQLGGKYTAYVPSHADTTLFASLNTRFYFKLRTKSMLPSEEMYEQLVSHFDHVQDFANSNPAITGTGMHLYTDKLKQVAMTQAMPYLYKGSIPIMVTLGKDITLEDYIGENSFLGGQSQAGLLSRDFIRRLSQFEEQNHGQEWSDKRFNPSLFPFINLWPWLFHDDPEDATEFVRHYMNVARPLIVITHSRPVTSIVKANFIHQHGALSSSFTAQVCQLSIQFYSARSDSGMVDNDDAFICIPQIDPGRDKYGSQDLQLRRVLDLSMHLMFLVGSIAINVIDHCSSLPNRKQLCERVITEVEKFLSSTIVGKKFSTALESAKKALQMRWSKIYNRMASEDARPILDAPGRKLIASIGEAEGPPNSLIRRTQLEQLWGKYPDLHLIIPYRLDRKEDWIQSLMPLRQNQYYFLQVTSQLEPDEYLTHLLSKFRPLWVKNDSWLNNSKARKEAVVECGLWIHKKLPPGSSEKHFIKRHFPDEFIPTSKMEGHVIGVHADKGRFTLRWKREDGTTCNLRLTSKIAIPRRPQDIRAVSFTVHGIDIVDASGTPFRMPTRSGSISDATIPRLSFASVEAGHLVIELWTAVLGHLGIPIPLVEDFEGIKDWGSTKGVNRLSSVAREEVPRQNRPPQPHDANYLLVQFLAQRFPSGGTFRTASSTRVLDSTEDLQAFVAFLKQPEYSAHPYSAQWLADLDKEKPTVEVLEKNIVIYRESRKERQTKYQAHLGNLPKNQRLVKETMFHLGPIRSATGPDEITQPQVIASTTFTTSGTARSSAAGNNVRKETVGSDDKDNDPTGSVPSKKQEPMRNAATSAAGTKGRKSTVVYGRKRTILSDVEDEDEVEASVEVASKKLVSKRRRKA